MTAPLTPADCDLTGFDWFRLYHRRLKQSEWWLSASDLARSRNVDLWCEAADQVPAASLPNSDVVLARFAGYGRNVAEFQAVKDEIMAPWVLCDDGRWYHPRLAEAALEGWAAREAMEAKRAADRERKKSKGTPADSAPPSGPLPPTSKRPTAEVAAPSGGNPAENALRREERRGEESQDASASSVGSAEPMPTASAAEAGLLGELTTGAAKAKAWQRDASFVSAWDACTPDMRGRSASRDKTWPVWARAAIAAGGPERLLSAVQAYVAGDKDIARTGCPAFDRWLRDGKWQHWLGVADAARPAATWTGPPDLRAAAAALKGDPWCVSYLDRCGWHDLPQRTLVSPSAFATRVIASELGELLARSSITLEDRRAA